MEPGIQEIMSDQPPGEESVPPFQDVQVHFDDEQELQVGSTGSRHGLVR